MIVRKKEMSLKGVTVTVPASTANLGPGFDTIGMALQLYASITMREEETTTVLLRGEHLHGVPTDEKNLLYQVAAHLYQRAGKPAPRLFIEVESDIPLTRGLGSSAAAIVGALVGANALLGEPFSREELFAMGSRWEGHPDNVGASLFGGIVVAAMPEEDDSLNVPHIRLPVPHELEILAVIPLQELSTAKARSVLPPQYERRDVVFNISHSSLLVAALAQGRLDLIGQAMKDRVHQPYRASLIPGMQELLDGACEHGALGAALSGAGPTMVCLVSGDSAKRQLVSFVQGVMEKHGQQTDIKVLLPDREGAVCKRLN